MSRRGEFDVDLAHAGWCRGETAQRGGKHGGENAPAVAPGALLRGMGLVHHLTGAQIAQDQADLALEPGRGVHPGGRPSR